MINLFNLFDSFKKPANTSILTGLKEISKLTHSINSQKKKLELLEEKYILEKKEEYYISLEEFLSILDLEKVPSLSELMKKFKHASELGHLKYSTVSVYPIIEDDHIILCTNPKECEKHKDFKGDPILITTIRR